MPDPRLDPGVTSYSYPGGETPNYLNQAVEDEGVPVTENAVSVNYVGTGVVAKDQGDGSVDVEVPGAATITGFLEAASIKEYTLVGRASFPFDVINGYFKTGSGTATVTIKVDGVGIAGLTDIPVTSIALNPVAAIPVQVAVGSRITMDVTAAALPVDLEVCVGIEKIVE